MGSDVKALAAVLREMNASPWMKHFAGDDWQTVLGQAAEALEKAEAVIEPFADAAAKADAKAAEVERLGMGRLSDNASTGLGIKFGHVRAAADWKRQYGRAQDNG